MHLHLPVHAVVVRGNSARPTRQVPGLARKLIRQPRHTVCGTLDDHLWRSDPAHHQYTPSAPSTSTQRTIDTHPAHHRYTPSPTSIHTQRTIDTHPAHHRYTPSAPSIHTQRTIDTHPAHHQQPPSAPSIHTQRTIDTHPAANTRRGHRVLPTSVRTLLMDPKAPYVFTSFNGDQEVFMIWYRAQHHRVREEWRRSRARPTLTQIQGWDSCGSPSLTCRVDTRLVNTGTLRPATRRVTRPTMAGPHTQPRRRLVPDPPPAAARAASTVDRGNTCRHRSSSIHNMPGTICESMAERAEQPTRPES
jgi:hypothetical protein